jgi:hypothetical protein
MPPLLERKAAGQLVNFGGNRDLFHYGLLHEIAFADPLVASIARRPQGLPVLAVAI